MILTHYYLSFVFFYFYIILIINGYPSKIPIASFTVPGDREQGVIGALNFTINMYNQDIYSKFKIKHHNKALRNAAFDVWGVMKKICSELQEGLMIMMAGVDGNQRTYEAYSTVSSTMEIPFVNWDISAISPLDNYPNKYVFFFIYYHITK